MESESRPSTLAADSQVAAPRDEVVDALTGTSSFEAGHADRGTGPHAMALVESGDARRGVVTFLTLTFALTYLIEFGLIAAGVRFEPLGASSAGASTMLTAQLVVAMTMWVPAFSAFVTIRFVTHESFAATGLRFGSWRPYVATLVLVPLAFAATYAITWGLGLGEPDWQLRELTASLTAAGADVADAGAAPPANIVLPALFVASMFLAPFVNSVFGFGEEFGWRGYLLPKLTPLGKPAAYLLLGVIWGLWHAPLIAVGFNYPGYPVLGVLAMIGMTTTLGIYINELTLHYRSSILAGWVHGVFNSQAYGVWRILFPGTNPLLGGMTGLVGMAVWTALGLSTAWFLGRRPGAPEG